MIFYFYTRRPSDVESPNPTSPGSEDNAGVFGTKPSNVPKTEPSAIQPFTFAQPKSDTFRAEKSAGPTKRSAPSSSRDDSYTKRPIRDWSDPFSDGSGKQFIIEMRWRYPSSSRMEFTI